MAASASAASGGKLKGILLVLFGLGLVLFWIAASTLQIQTNEIFINHGGSATGLVPNWAVLYQPIDFIQGKLDVNMTKSVMVGWGIEAVYLICILGWEVAHASVRASNKMLADIAKTGMVLIILFDGYCDFVYGSNFGFWEQLGFTVMTSFVVMFFGLIGIGFIEHGVDHLH